MRIPRWSLGPASASVLLLACSAESGRDELTGGIGSGWSDASGGSTGAGQDDASSDAGEGESDDTEGSTPQPDDDDASSDGDALPDPDFTNIARVQVPAEWAVGNGDVWPYSFEAEVPPDYDVARAFYETHNDDYDFLAVYTEGEFEEFFAHAIVVHEDLSGIRLGDEPQWSQAAQAGSAGRLQQINMMNAPGLYPDPGAADILIHETSHRWAAFIGLEGTSVPDALLGPAGGHWNIHVNTGGPSATGYGDLFDLGGGNFRFEVIYPLQLSPLELYLAGLIPAGEVPPLFYVANPTGHEPAINAWGETLGLHSYGEDATFSGTRVDFTVDDVVAANGERLPAYGSAQTEFRVGIVMVCADVTQCDLDALSLVEQQRVAFESQFGPATGDRATVDTTL